MKFAVDEPVHSVDSPMIAETHNNSKESWHNTHGLFRVRVRNAARPRSPPRILHMCPQHASQLVGKSDMTLLEKIEKARLGTFANITDTIKRKKSGYHPSNPSYKLAGIAQPTNSIKCWHETLRTGPTETNIRKSRCTKRQVRDLKMYASFRNMHVVDDIDNLTSSSSKMQENEKKTHPPSLIAAKTFHNSQMISLVKFLSMMHIHKRRGSIPSERAQQMQAAGVRKVGHSSDSFQEPETRNGASIEVIVKQLAGEIIDKPDKGPGRNLALLKVAFPLAIGNSLAAQNEIETFGWGVSQRRVQADQTTKGEMQLAKLYNKVFGSESGDVCQTGLVHGFVGIEVGTEMLLP